MTLTARDEASNEGRSEPFCVPLARSASLTKLLARALVEQRRNLALDTGARPQVTTALDALTLAPEKFTPDAGIYLGLRSIFWTLIRAGKSDDDLARRHRAVVLQMAVGIEDGNISDAQANLRNAEEGTLRAEARARRQLDEEIKKLMDLIAGGDGSLRRSRCRKVHQWQEQFSSSARPLDRNSRRVLSQRATSRACSIGWKIPARSGGKRRCTPAFCSSSSR